MNLFNAVMTRFAKTEPPSQDPKSGSLWAQTAVSELIDLLSRVPESDDLLKQANITRASLKKLCTDDEIFGLLRTRRESVVATPWRLEGGNEIIKQLLMEELKPHMESMVAGAWNAVPFGYSVMEAVYHRRDDGKIGLSEIGIKPLEWFDPRPDGSLKYFAPDGFGAGVGGVECDTILKFFLTRSDASYAQPKGEALLSRLYWPWFFRFNGWRFWGQFVERYGQPLMVGKSSNPTAMLAALIAIHQDACIAVGKEDSVEVREPTSNGEVFEKLEQAIVKRYQKIILGQTLTSDTGAKGGGSYALGKVHADVKEGLRKADIRLVCGTVQRCVTALCILNGVVDDIPEVTFADDAGLEMGRAERDNKLSSIGVKFTRDYFLDRYDLTETDFDVVEKLDINPLAATDKNSQKQSPEETDIKPVDEEDAQFAKRRVSDPNRFTPAQQKIEDEANLALKRSSQPINPSIVRSAILAAKDPSDLADRLAVIMQDQGTQNTQFQRTLEQALFVADVIGYINAEGKL